MAFKNYILIGPDPNSNKIIHPGGQLSDVALMIKYADENNINLLILDTYRSSFPLPSRLNKLFQWVKLCGQLVKILIFTKFDGAIVLSSSGLSLYERITYIYLLRVFRCKTLLTLRDGIYLNHKLLGWKKILHRLLFKAPSLIGLQGTPWVSFYQSMKVPNDKLILIRNWYNVEAVLTPSSPADKVKFVFIGWMTVNKGVMDLFSVIKDHRELDIFEFYFIGAGTMFDFLANEIIVRQLKNINLLGWMNQEQIHSLLPRMDVLVLPTYTEGFPHAILDGMKHKLSIISTDVGCIADSVINDFNGILIKPGDKEALFKAILKLGCEQNLRHEFGERSYQILVNNHNYKDNLRLLFAAFNKIN
jgi:glycosyltransferase involved in cell wall biosynthesis